VKPLLQWGSSITYSECGCVALGIQHAMRMRRVILRSVTRLGLPYFSTLHHKRHAFRTKVEHITCFSFLTPLVRTISHCKYSWATYYHKHKSVLIRSTRYSCHIWMKLEIVWQIFGKYSNIEFHKNPSIRSRAVPRGQTDRQTDMAKLTALKIAPLRQKSKTGKWSSHSQLTTNG